MIKDSTYRKAKFAENHQFFICPICKSGMNVYELKDIVCTQGHSFNIARKGYVNFLLKPVKTDYDDDMFHSRNLVYASGFFDPLLESISDSIAKRIGERDLNKVSILDAGCGDGSHIGHITGNLADKANKDIKGFGVDISKEGILLASKNYYDILWCVADLANLPFLSGGFDAILNILSPANYHEFHRVLKDDGILIKVVPGSSYLKELRNIFYEGTDKVDYSNQEIIEHYSNKFKILDIIQLKYDHKVDKEQLIHLIGMTPLSWGITHDKIKRVVDMNIDAVSVEFSIIIGEKRKL